MGKIQNIPIKDCFAKGLIDGHGMNKIPANFATYSRNQRVENGSTTVKKGYITRVSDSSGTFIKAITANSQTKNLLCCSDSKLKLVDLNNSVLTDIGSIGTDLSVNMFNHGKYTIILTGIGKGYVYDGTTLTQLSTTEPDENCLLGVAFSGFTVIAGNKTASENFIYFSAPVTPTNPERAYDRVANGAEKRNMQSKVLGLVAGLNNLYIFTQNSVEYVGKDSLSTVGGTFSFYSSPIGEGDQLMNRNCAVTANDKAFYLTKSFVIKTLNYILGTTDPAIGELSDRPMLSIRNFLDVQLNDDQSDAFAMRKDDKVFWYLKSVNSPINDIALVYDITNDNWYVDDSIYYSCMVKYDGKYYAGSCLNSDIIEDESGYDMDGDGILFQYKSVNLNFGNPVRRKLFKGWELAGEISEDCELVVETIVDGFTVDSKTIYGKDYIQSDSGVGSIGNAPIGGQPIAGVTGSGVVNTLVPFEVVDKQGNINVKGKQIQLKITSDKPNARFYLDYLAFMVLPIGNYQLQDVL